MTHHMTSISRKRTAPGLNNSKARMLPCGERKTVCLPDQFREGNLVTTKFICQARLAHLAWTQHKLRNGAEIECSRWEFIELPIPKRRSAASTEGVCL